MSRLMNMNIFQILIFVYSFLANNLCWCVILQSVSILSVINEDFILEFSVRFGSFIRTF